MPNWATKVALGWVATDVRLLCIASLKRLLGDPSSGGGFFERLSKKGANYDINKITELYEKKIHFKYLEQCLYCGSMQKYQQAAIFSQFPRPDSVFVVINE
ncbi:hypothetical protein T10_11130 [Trichinella papuae]|uniref:Uncharacterized protein n=1 Tax=Trichinella papuae TaxID=268474 RepID=A0A0V1MVE4_9BILA|nr:hypothetical protein T10_11130 [Trichinella papuae]